MPLPERVLWPCQVLAEVFGFRGAEISAMRLPQRLRLARIAESQDRLYRDVDTPPESAPFRVRRHRVFEPLREQLIHRRNKARRPHG
jgi:hypothetical protein